MRRLLDKLALEQKLLVEELNQEDDDLQHLREIKEMREAEALDYSEKLRKYKMEHFNSQEKLAQICKINEQKRKELESIN